MRLINLFPNLKGIENTSEFVLVDNLLNKPSANSVLNFICDLCGKTFSAKTYKLCAGQKPCA